jgi:hypothetical protein
MAKKQKTDYRDILETVRSIVFKQLERLEGDFDLLEPEQRVKYLPKFIEICVPKMDSTKNHALTSNPFDMDF